MKQAFFLVTLFIATSSITAQKIDWMTMDEALAAQQETPKKYLWMSIPLGVARVSY